MRDQVHMIRTLLAVYRAWRRCPELRLGQMLVCANGETPALFYAEDECLARRCDRWAP